MRVPYMVERRCGDAPSVCLQAMLGGPLSHTEERLSAVIDSALSFAIVVTDPDGRVTDWSRGAEQILGWPARDMIGRPVADIFTPEDRAGGLPVEERRRALAEGRCWVGRWHERRDGQRFWASGEMSVLRDRAGEHIGFVKVLRDATAQAHSESQRAIDAMRDSEQRYKTLFNAIDEGFCIIEFFDGPHGPLSDYIHLEANDAYARHAGIPNVVGRKLREVLGEEADSWVERFGSVLETGVPIRFQQELVATARHLELAAFRIEPASRKQVAILFQDITPRKRAEAALRESEEQFRVFAQTVPNHVWASHPDGSLFWFNNRVYAYAGEAHGSLDGANWTKIVHPDDLGDAARLWGEALSAGSVYETEFRIRGADGTYRWFLVRAQPVRGEDGTILSWIGTNTDIENTRRQAAELENLNATLEQQVQERTGELMAAEEALRQSQKMEAVGQLTGGLAHDFNNLLAGITGSLEMLERRVAQGRVGEIDRYVTAAQGAAKRATALTHRLLAFSRRQTLDPKPTDVNRLVAGMDELVRRTMGPGISVEVVAAAGLWATLVDPNQLENALLNLCINARDAMPEGGKLTIETANRWIDERTARGRDMQPGQYISLCVSDTGTGMTPDVIAKAFDPFFTTKPIGQGTGLGLSMIYGFAKQSGGQVRIYSEVGQGAMVCIYLPRHTGESAEVEHETEEAATAAPALGETVLVVDDEPLVRMLVVETLQELGYGIIEAADGPSGLKILRSGARIDLLVTDVGLPGGMNGRQMADAGRALRPGLKVLFITGYAENAVLGHGHLDHGMHVMTKPFALDKLTARIKDLLAAP